MDIATENAIPRIIERFTPEQEESLGKDAEWANKAWSNEYLARQLEKVISGCGYEALLRSMETSDEFMIAAYNMVARAVTIQRALDMHRYSATFDEVA